MKIFLIVLDNSENLSDEIVQNFYKLLGVNTKDEKLNEFIQEAIRNFDFYRIENNILLNIRNTIDEELKKIRIQKDSNGVVNYQGIAIELMEKLKQIKLEEFSLDEDFKNLSNAIVNKFPLTGLTREQFYSHFMSKKEQLVNMIMSYNNTIIETLVRLSPKLLEEFQNFESQNIQKK